jgi:hypothetical protein
VTSASEILCYIYSYSVRIQRRFVWIFIGLRSICVQKLKCGFVCGTVFCSMLTRTGNLRHIFVTFTSIKLKFSLSQLFVKAEPMCMKWINRNYRGLQTVTFVCKNGGIIPSAGLGACVCKCAFVPTSVGLPNQFKICGEIKYICVMLKMLMHIFY